MYIVHFLLTTRENIRDCKIMHLLLTIRFIAWSFTVKQLLTYFCIFSSGSNAKNMYIETIRLCLAWPFTASYLLTYYFF